MGAGVVTLSAVNHCQGVPRDARANCRYRQQVLKSWESERADLKRKCKEDIFFWIDTFVFQFNPKNDSGSEGEYGLFICRDQQRAAIRKILWCIENGKDLVIEKSRQEGGSWIIVLCFVWMWLFFPGKVFLMVSRKQDLVDSHWPGSLFWKVDLILKYTPRWLLPAGWNPKVHRLKNYFENPELGSFIHGESTTEDLAVGETLTAILLDEFARVPKDYTVLESTVQSTNCRIFNSTHLGTDTAFNELCNRENIEKIILHWTHNPIRMAGWYKVKGNQVVERDPNYDFGHYEFVIDGSPDGGYAPGMRSVWYDIECKRTGNKRGVAQNLDINPSGAVAQFFESIKIAILKEKHTAGQHGKDFWEGSVKLQDARIVEWVEGPGPIRYWGRLDEQRRPRVVPGDFYGMGADISEGRGRTPSCLSLCHETGRKVLAVATAEIVPWEFAILAVSLCRYFNDALLAWERPGPGLMFGEKVLGMGYRRIYWHEQEGTAKKAIDTNKPGWQNDGAELLLLLLMDYKEALEYEHFLNPCWFALDETLQFRYNRNGYPEHAEYNCMEKDPSGARINHGDRVIGDALAWRCVRTRAKLIAEQRKEPKAERYDLRTSAGRLEYAGLIRQQEW